VRSDVRDHGPEPARTHEGFNGETEARDEAIDSVAAAASRALRQVEMGLQLVELLGDDEQSWLGADLG
jgi:hypothetical protein